MTETVTAVAPSPATPAPQVQPAAPTAPAAESPIKRGMTTKEGFDAFFKQKAQQAQQVKPAAQAEQPKTAPAVAEAAPEEPAVAPAQVPEPVQEARPEPIEEEPRAAEEQPQEQDQEPPLPKQLIEAIDPNADPRARRALRELAFIGLGYRNSGMRLGDVKEYLAIAPTKEVLRDISAAAQTAREMMADFRDPSPEGKVRFVQRLASTDMDSFTNFISTVTEPGWFEKAMPDRFVEISKVGTRNFLAWAKREGTRTNNQDLVTAAEILAEYGGGAVEDSRPAQREDNVPPEVADRLHELEARDRANREQQHNMFVRTAYQAAGRDVAERIDGIIDQAMPETSYSQDARDEARRRIGDALIRGLGSNPHVVNKLDELAFSGRYDDQHLGMLAGFMRQQAIAALPLVSGPVIEQMLKIAGANKGGRPERRTPSVPQRREVSSQGGRPATATRQEPLQTKGKDTKAVFDDWWSRKQAEAMR